MRPLEKTVPLLDMLEAARHYIRDQSGLGSICEISFVSWLEQIQFFAMTDHAHSYRIFDPLI